MNAEMVFGLCGILVMLLLILFTGMSPGLAMLLVGTIGCISLMPEIVWIGVRSSCEVFTTKSSFIFWSLAILSSISPMSRSSSCLRCIM